MMYTTGSKEGHKLMRDDPNLYQEANHIVALFLSKLTPRLSIIRGSDSRFALGLATRFPTTSPSCRLTHRAPSSQTLDVEMPLSLEASPRKGFASCPLISSQMVHSS